MSNEAIRIRLQELKAKLCCIADSTLNLQPEPRIPHALRSTGAWTNTTNVFSFSVANVGAGNGTVLGATIKPGEIVNYDASSMNNFFASGVITVDGTGTELLISWISA